MANLWAGSAGATATPHYDAYHNIHVQVREGCPSCCVDPSLCETQWVQGLCLETLTAGEAAAGAEHRLAGIAG